MGRVDDVLGERQDHESYGMLGFYRVTCSGAQPLFGSSIKHKDTIMMTLKTGHMRRNLSFPLMKESLRVVHKVYDL